MTFGRWRRAKLAARLEFLEESQEVAHIGSWRADIGPETLLQLTAESYRILGFEPGRRLRNLDLFNAVHPDDRAQLLETVMKVRTESVRSELEVRFPRLDGGVRYVLITARPLSGDGEKSTITGTIQDITDHRRGGSNPAAERRVALERDLQRAIDDEQLFVEYQPILSLKRQGYVGAEALVRWNHPDRGVLKPGEFIGVAEESGLIVPLGAYVVSSACRELRRWLDAGVDAEFTVSINVSPLQLRSETFPDSLALAIEEAGVPATSVILEITESTLVECDLDESGLRTIQGRGVRIAIDDFGTKYSALGYLTRFPIDVLKIDESFVRDIHAGPDRTVVAAIAALGRGLGLQVTAEGIESEEQLDAVREIGCDAVQGFLISRPLSSEDCLRLVRSAPSRISR
ncbi:MAG TPA: EAL domain-containing protein [Acidimicrobiales bacterium]|nr:EAL domain-containing protein [Acidimicrobiales bacterium]